jgi:hypothetical protein
MLVIQSATWSGRHVLERHVGEVLLDVIVHVALVVVVGVLLEAVRLHANALGVHAVARLDGALEPAIEPVVQHPAV